MSRAPDWLLERVLLEEAPPLEGAANEERIAQLTADNAATLEKLPPASFAREVERRHALVASLPPRREGLNRWILVPAFAVFTFAVLFVRPMEERNEDAPEQTRLKGLSGKLVLHRQVGNRVEPLRPGDLAQEGEALQVSYLAAGLRHGVVISLDGRGEVTLHTPREGTHSASLAPSGTHALPNAYALDDAPNFERFILITSDVPFELAPVLAAARGLATEIDAATAPLVLPRGLRQTSFLVRKPSP